MHDDIEKRRRAKRMDFPYMKEKKRGLMMRQKEGEG